MKKSFILACIVSVVLMLSVPPFTAAAEPIIIKLHSPWPNVHVSYSHTKWAADEVYKRSNGRLKIEIYPAFSLGFFPPTWFRDHKAGLIEMSELSNLMTAGEEPSFSVLEADTLAKSRVDLNRAIRAYYDFKKRIYDEVWNTELLATGVLPAGTFVVGTREKQILTLDDFKGQKLRAPNARAGDLFKALGAAPQFMKKTELYMALKTGVVDGFGSGYGSLHAEKFHEVMKYVTWVGAPAATQEDIVVSRKIWNKLPDDLKKIMREVYAEWAERTMKDAESLRADKADKAALKKAGIITAELSAANRAKVQQIQLKLVEKYVNSQGGRVAEAWKMIKPVLMK